jgi:hypothetical protein
LTPPKWMLVRITLSITIKCNEIHKVLCRCFRLYNLYKNTRDKYHHSFFGIYEISEHLCP